MSFTTQLLVFRYLFVASITLVGVGLTDGALRHDREVLAPGAFTAVLNLAAMIVNERTLRRERRLKEP